MNMFLFFFFLQAEEGIRDLTVTGVQTCALPPHVGQTLVPAASCGRCGSPVAAGTRFCPTCGAPLVEPAPDRRSPAATGGPPPSAPPSIVLVLLDDSGAAVQRFERRSPDTPIGRQDGDIRFPEDVFLSPLHPTTSWEHTAA